MSAFMIHPVYNYTAINYQKNVIFAVMSRKHFMKESGFSGFLCDRLDENTLVSFSSARRSPHLR